MSPVALIFSGIFIVLNSLSFFVGLAQTGQFTTFLGTVHYPPDYLYYLSLIKQGQEHWLWTYNLYMPAAQNPQIIGWVYPLFGHVFSWLGIPPMATYQIMVVVASAAYLVTAYTLIRQLTQSKLVRDITFALFLLSNAYPRIYEKAGQWIFSIFYPWYNPGHPFVRFINVPHQTFIQALLFLILIIANSWWQTSSRRPWRIAAIAVASAALSSMQPVQWIFLACLLGAGILLHLYFGRSTFRHHPARILTLLAPLIAYLAVGTPVTIHMRAILYTTPYFEAARWESWQQVLIPFSHFVTINGPLTVIAFYGTFFLFLAPTIPQALLLLYAAVSVAIFYSPLPARFMILNARFLSAVTTLYFAYASALAITAWAAGARKNKAATAWFIAFLVIAITIPVTIQQIRDRNDFHPVSVNEYLPIGAGMAFAEAEKLSKPTDVFLVNEGFHTIFSAVTGRRVYYGPWASVEVVDYARLANAFLNGVMTDQQARKFLNENRITYVIDVTWIPHNAPYLTPVYRNDFMVIYKVTTGE